MARNRQRNSSCPLRDDVRVPHGPPIMARYRSAAHMIPWKREKYG